MPASVRRDVRRNRQALVDAARELFARGADVPMYRIAEHAGVGQATLYRHFPDRSLLAAAVALEALDALERDAAGAESVADLLAQAVASSARVPGLRRMMAEGDGAVTIPETRTRLRALFATAVREDRRAGRIDADLTEDDVLLLLQMLEGGISNAAGGDLDRHRAVSERALALAVAALRP